MKTEETKIRVNIKNRISPVMVTLLEMEEPMEIKLEEGEYEEMQIIGYYGKHEDLFVARNDEGEYITVVAEGDWDFIVKNYGSWYWE